MRKKLINTIRFRVIGFSAPSFDERRCMRTRRPLKWVPSCRARCNSFRLQRIALKVSDPAAEAVMRAQLLNSCYVTPYSLCKRKKAIESSSSWHRWKKIGSKKKGHQSDLWIGMRGFALSLSPPKVRAHSLLHYSFALFSKRATKVVVFLSNRCKIWKWKSCLIPFLALIP